MASVVWAASPYSNRRNFCTRKNFVLQRWWTFVRYKCSYSQGNFTYTCMCEWFSYATKFRTFSERYEIHEIKIEYENFCYYSIILSHVVDLTKYSSVLRKLDTMARSEDQQVIQVVLSSRDKINVSIPAHLAKNRPEAGHQIFRKKMLCNRGIDALSSAEVTARQVATRRRLIFRVAAVRRENVSRAQLLLFWCMERTTKAWQNEKRKHSTWTLSCDLWLLKLRLKFDWEAERVWTRAACLLTPSTSK